MNTRPEIQPWMMEAVREMYWGSDWKSPYPDDKYLSEEQRIDIQNRAAIIAAHAPKQDALLQQLQELADEMINERAHTYASENADRYMGFDAAAHAYGAKLKAIIEGSKKV